MKKSIFAPFAAQVTSWWTRITFRSLHVRLALWALLLLGIAQVVVGSVLIVLLSAWLAIQMDNNLLVTASQVASVLFEEDDPANPIDASKLKSRFSNVSFASQTYLREQLFFVRLVDSGTGSIIETSVQFDVPPNRPAPLRHNTKQ